MSAAKRSSGGGFIPGIVLGGLAGAVLAWLYAPQAGWENRRLLAERGAEALSHLDEWLPGARTAVQERAMAVVAEQRQRLQQAVEEARRASKEARRVLTERYEAAKRRGSA